ncbi:CapA family protein [Paenibacillus marinisediminis]
MTSRFGRRGAFLAACVLVLVLMTACSSYPDSGATPLQQLPSAESTASSEHSLTDNLEQNTPPAQTSSPSIPSAPPETVEPTSLSILAVGDIMMHSPQFPAYLDERTGKYDFTSYFTSVKPYIEKADLAWCNLETPLLGGEKVYTGYPMFNAPPELADALKSAGFDIVTNANNHALDRRAKGVEQTLKVLKERELVTRGTYASLWDSMQPTIVEKNNIKLGVLAYTYGTNGIPLPKDQPYMVDLIDEEKMLADIKQLRKAGAEVVAVALHFGNEYEPLPSKEQKRLARSLAAGGADIIFGSHPHVLQPYERVHVTTDDGSTKDAIIMYSLGNFISNQRGDNTDIGSMFQVTIQKDQEGNISLDEAVITPTWVNRTRSNGNYKYEIIPLANEVMNQDTDRWSASQLNMMANMLQKTDKHVYSMSEIPVLKATP